MKQGGGGSSLAVAFPLRLHQRLSARYSHLRNSGVARGLPSQRHDSWLRYSRSSAGKSAGSYRWRSAGRRSFGRVPQRKQLLLAGVALGSILWVVTLIGVLVPDFGAWLIAFVPAPNFVDEGWIRLLMLGLAIVLPLAVVPEGSC